MTEHREQLKGYENQVETLIVRYLQTLSVDAIEHDDSDPVQHALAMLALENQTKQHENMLVIATMRTSGLQQEGGSLGGF